MKGEPKSVSRYLRRHGESKDQETEYLDVAGNVFSYQWVAKLSSFLHIFVGCLKNGFPIVRKRMRYSGWAFWPFFFVRADVDDKVVRSAINHERIHIRQQWEIHKTLSIPILIGCIVLEILGYGILWGVLCTLPFIPTIFYGIDMLRVYVKWNEENLGKPTFSSVRARTCYEVEASMHQLNDEYLKDRKFWAVLKYLK